MARNVVELVAMVLALPMFVICVAGECLALIAYMDSWGSRMRELIVAEVDRRSKAGSGDVVTSFAQEILRGWRRKADDPLSDEDVVLLLTVGTGFSGARLRGVVRRSRCR